jgi:RNA ligase (TIGR02306 family)
MRKLASVQIVKDIKPIEGAELIEVAQILGWNVVVKKGDFAIGNKVIYCEIDSILPDRPEFEFLKPRGMRIKTIRLKGQISQGICFPVHILSEPFLPKDKAVQNGYDLEEGTDVTENLGITKYEPAIPACLSGIAKGKFPSFIPKTDEIRVQVLQEVLNRYKGTKCYVAEKLDGSSATYYIKDGVFGVCSRNLELLEDNENSFWKVAKEYDIEQKLRSIGNDIAIQGELIGEGIQGNKLKIKGQKVYFFNAFDIDKFEYLNFFDFNEMLAKIELPIVPIIALDYELENDIDAIIRMATIKSQILNDVWAEGIVIRPYIEKLDFILSNMQFHNGRVSFKAINPEFLLKYGE